MKWWIWLIILFGLGFLSLVVKIVYVIMNLVGPVSLGFDYPPKEAANNPRCSAIDLEIISVNATTKKMIVKRNLGGVDLSKLKIYYRGIKSVSNVDASNLNENTEIILSIGYQIGKSHFGRYLSVGDEVLIAPILNDGTLCDLKDLANAVA
jgi:hypothetical protein